MVHLIPHVRDYPNQEYQAQLCYKALLGTPEALLPSWTIYFLVVPNLEGLVLDLQGFFGRLNLMALRL